VLKPQLSSVEKKVGGGKKPLASKNEGYEKEGGCTLSTDLSLLQKKKGENGQAYNSLQFIGTGEGKREMRNI